MFRPAAAVLCALLVLPALADSAFARDLRRTEQVEFPRHAASVTLEGSLKGYETVDYVFPVRAGEIIRISINTTNPSNCFNVTAPGEHKAMFDGSVSGGAFMGGAMTGGDYRVRVYLMRNAARRNQAASYSLTIALRR